MPKKSHVNGALAVRVSARGAGRLRDGHVWVYRSDVLAADEVAAGALVKVVDERGVFLGTAFYSSTSQIAIRIISKEAVEDLARLLCERIRASLAYRERVVTDSNAYRLIFSEADFLPGLIGDRYNDLLSFQVLTQAMDAEPVRATFVSELKDTLSPAAIVERVEPKIRQLEQLPARGSALVMGEKSSTVFSMHGVHCHYDAKGLQRAEFAGAADAALWGHSGYVLLFLPRQPLGFPGDCSGSSPRFSPEPPSAGKPRTGKRPSDAANCPRNRLSKVPHTKCNLLKYKHYFNLTLTQSTFIIVFD